MVPPSSSSEVFKYALKKSQSMCVEIWKEEIHRTRPEPLQTERIRNGSGSSGRKIMLVWKQKSEHHLLRIQFWSQNSLPRKVAHSKPRTHYQPDPVEFKLPGWSFVSPVQRICPKTVCCGEIERPSWSEEQNEWSRPSTFILLFALRLILINYQLSIFKLQGSRWWLHHLLSH